MPDAELPPLRWLLLDVGGVLERVDDDAWPERFRERWAARLGLTAEGFAARLDAADLPDIAVTSGRAEEYWRRFATAVDATAEQAAALRADFWDAYCGTGDETLLRHLRLLRSAERAPRLAILSNSGDGAREEEERRFGFAALFDPILYSHEIGVLKPDPAAFRIALERMRAEPGEVLFVDDHEENVLAARELGIRAHLHRDAVGTIAAIERERAEH